MGTLTLIGTLARCAVWLLRREAARDKKHRKENDSRDCMCDCCGWVRGVEADTDEVLGRRWRG